MTLWRSIGPSQVSEMINFNAADSDWHYDSDPDSMFGKQAEGTARLYNLLSQHRIALLADEVGMGKTYQALGVAALVWKQNPEARIMIIAPNNSVALNWCDEYDSFIKKNYRRSDNIVRTTLEEAPVYAPCFCASLLEISQVAIEKWCHLFVAKTSSFSYVLNTQVTSPVDREQAARDDAAAIRNQIPFTFDLLIVDEAHYFRNKSGGSLRVNAAQGFFSGGHAGPLAERVLLMTATPNHSGVSDIKNIISYFDSSLAAQTSEAILDAIGVRRFRRLAGKNKYQYRKEVTDAAGFGSDIEAELFFALYQKKLAQIHRGGQGRRFMYGYLEGFESMTPPDTVAPEDPETHANGRDAESTDYHKSIDTEILQTLAAEFKKINGKPPAHPKYNTFIGNITAKISSGDLWNPDADVAELKHLVFTRRIPSVTEITGRINQIYDEQYLKKIGTTVGTRLSDLLAIADPDEFRRRFDALMKTALRSREEEADPPGEDDTEAQDQEDSGQSRFASSRVLDLFTVKKKEGGAKVVERTHASNFRARFIRKDSPYVLFFEPASDYRKGIYPLWKAESGEEKLDYRTNASDLRASGVPPISSGMPDTLWALFYSQLETSSNENHRLAKQEIDRLSPEWKEAFARYLQKGVLLASSGLIELYCWFLEAIQEDGQAAYETYMEVTARRLRNSHLFTLLCEAVMTFRKYAEKVCAATTVERIKEHRWRFFNNQNPAAAVTGSTNSRDRHIKAFNSPFFPNALIATSVFQEGVNLQFFCRNVHHYGIAWTPGDNEQRVGRIDRLFSLTERRLEKCAADEMAFLLSRYPFLKGTLDETQLISFLKKKLEVENITDRCGAVYTDKEIDMDCSIKDWQKLLRTPVETSNVQDPYPAGNGTSSDYTPHPDPYPDFHPESLLTQIQDTMKDMCLQGNVVAGFSLYTPIQDDSADHIRSRRTIGMADVVLQNQRRQPFYIELFFSSEFSGVVKGLVYCLRFLTPFDDGRNHKQNSRKLYEEWVQPEFFGKYPLAKLALKSTGDFRACMAVDLPFFFDKEETPYLDNAEIALGLEQLLWGADQLEQQAFEDKRDLHIKTHGFQEVGYGCPPATQTQVLAKERICDVDTCWQQLECCLVREFAVSSQGLKRYGKDTPSLLAANYENPALCFFRDQEGSRCRLALPFVDLQEKEFELLGQWFELNRRRFAKSLEAS